MPRGPRGERRPNDVAQNALKVLKIAVGDEKEDIPSGKRRSGIAGAKARKEALTSEQRREIAKKAANARWR